MAHKDENATERFKAMMLGVKFTTNLGGGGGTTGCASVGSRGAQEGVVSRSGMWQWGQEEGKNSKAQLLVEGRLQCITDPGNLRRQKGWPFHASWARRSLF